MTQSSIEEILDKIASYFNAKSSIEATLNTGNNILSLKSDNYNMYTRIVAQLESLTDI